MALEKRWAAVSQAFTADGTLQGVVPVADSSGFFAKQTVSIISDTQPRQDFQVKRVYPGQIWVGLTTTGIMNYIDVSAYKLADHAVITANEQVKPTLKPDEIWQAVYQFDPAVAIRGLGVDENGNPWGPNNPMPVSASSGGGGIVPSKYGDVKATYDVNGNVTRYDFYSQTVLQGYIIISYDVNGNQIDYQGYNASGMPL